MVEAILLLARRMQLRVVAEGVETSEQAQLLASWNQSILFQGYHYGHPLPVSAWLAMVLRRSDTVDDGAWPDLKTQVLC